MWLFRRKHAQESKRFCVESHLARENLLVEIQIVATI